MVAARKRKAEVLTKPITSQAFAAFAARISTETLGVVAHARTLILSDGDQKGTPYDPDTHPAQSCLLQAIDAGASWIAVAKPVQDGGTLATLAPLLRRIGAMGQTGLIAYPTMDSAKDAWTTKIWPMMESQGGMAPETGGGSRGGAARIVTLPSGGRAILRAAGGRGESGQASITVDCMLIDEVDDWEDLRRLRLIERRMSRSPDPLILYVSTVKRDGTEAAASMILNLFQEGTQTRLHYPCVACATLQPFDWERVNRANFTIKCAHCGHEMSEDDRQTSLKQWQRVDGAKTDKFSIRWTALDSPFPIVISGKKMPVLQGLCEEYKLAELAVARNDHGLMRQFVRDRLTSVYQPPEVDGMPHQISRVFLSGRSSVSNYGPARLIRDGSGDSKHISEVPRETQYMCSFVDVQRGGNNAPGRLYWIMSGHHEDGRMWDAAWGSLALSPIGHQATTQELHTGLDRMHQQLSDLEQEYACPLVRRGIDVGDRQDELRLWLVRHHEWLAVKGSESNMRVDPAASRHFDVAGWIYRRLQDSGAWWLHFVDTDQVRRQSLAGFLVPQGRPGAHHVPRGLDQQAAIIRHYCATAEIPDGRGGTRWSSRQEDRKHHPDHQTRHDYLDCRVGALALAYEYARHGSTKQVQLAPQQQTREQEGWVSGGGNWDIGANNWNITP